MAHLYIYNPTCDLAVENGTNSFMPSKLLTKFEQDISPLMAFLGNGEDYLLTTTDDNSSFNEFWEHFAHNLPKPIKHNEVLGNNIQSIVPWGWSQIIKHKYGSLVDKSHIPSILTSNEDYRTFFSRTTSLKLITELKKKVLPNNVSIPHLPVAVTNIENIAQLLKTHNKGIVLKTLWSSSGRGLLFIKSKEQFINATNWINAQLKKQGQLIAEPIYNKIQDASLQFTISERGQYDFLGINYFDSDTQGHFNKEFLHVPEQIKKCLPAADTWLTQTANAIIDCMQTLRIHDQYNGPIGVDALFFKDENNVNQFYPLVEANLRCNMGLVNLSIKKLFAPNTCGSWQITQFKTNEAVTFYQEQKTKHPLVIKNGKIEKGFFPLSYFEYDTRFAAWGIAE